jgi:hypothetical protein
VSSPTVLLSLKALEQDSRASARGALALLRELARPAADPAPATGDTGRELDVLA